MELSRKKWPDGWIPTDNNIGGRTSGLLRMDNLYLDDNGIVSLVPGLRRLNSSQLEGTVHSIYSQNFDNQKIRFVGLSNGTVKAAASDFSTSADIITGGNAEIATFCTMFGWVFAASGRKIVRYNVSTVEPVGMKKPEPPVVTTNTGPVARVVEDYLSATVVTGVLISQTTDIQFTTTDTIGVVETVPNQGDTMVLSSNGVGAESDRIEMPVVVADSTKIVRIRLEFRISDTDYYYFEWVTGAEGSPLNVGLDVPSVLSAKRNEFTRAGSESSADWSDISLVRISAETTESTNIQFQRVSIFGGERGSLASSYQYRIQCVAKVETDGIINYIAQSPASEPTEVILPWNQTVNVYPPTEPAENYFMDEWWVYRRSAEPSYDINPLLENRRLDQWYRVAVIPFGEGEVEDYKEDAEVIKDGVILDETIASIVDLTEEIAGMTGLVSGRNWYLTNSLVIPSLVDCPDAYRPQQAIKLSGSNSEKNLWIQKGDDGAIYVGTTEDVYRISGDFFTLNDGTISATVRGLGLGNGFQPISRSVTYARSTIFYLSSNGWISLNGTTPELIVGDLDFLFRKTQRHGFPYVNIIPNGLALYAVCVRKNQLWCSNNMSDGTRRLFIYDFERKYWHVRNLDPVSLFVEKDGTILGGFGGGSGNYLNELDFGSDLAGINGQNIHLLTVFDDVDKPNQRKDWFTLRIWAKSSGNVSFEIAQEGESFISVGTKNFSNAGSEFFVDIPTYFADPGKSIALQIKGSDLSFFQLLGYQFEFDERPVQQNYLRVQPTNLGTISRKRFTAYALVIDTLGGTVSVTPLLDNVAADAVEFQTEEKLTIIYYFLNDSVATDISSIIRSTNSQVPFEYYGINLEETVSEKLPTPTKFLLIPANDYGNPNRKRHSSYKFQINTRGGLVRFTPKIDGTTKTPLTFSTSEKRTQDFFFTEDNIGVDIGGTLESLENIPFEFYGVLTPQNLEVFPPRLKEYRAPETNYGIPARKRVRTMPMRINTNGTNVEFTPVVDNVVIGSSTFNTTVPTTVFHYFTTDVFGIDFSGEFIGTEWFEFYGFEKPEEVQVLPVAKKFDQVGPMAFDRIGKLYSFRIRGIFYTSTIEVTVYVEDAEVTSFTLDTIIGVDKTYEQMQMPKTVAGTTMRFEIGPAVEAFHRYDVEIKVSMLGMGTDNKWLKLK